MGDWGPLGITSLAFEALVVIGSVWMLARHPRPDVISARMPARAGVSGEGRR